MKVLVTGKNGLVGNALYEERTNHDFVFVGREDADLTDEHQVDNLIGKIKPDWLISTAAMVGGIGGNLSSQGSYFRDNILMNTHIIHNAWKHRVKKLMVFTSVCAFPSTIPVIREDLLHKGEPFHANFAYGYAKRMVDIQICAYKEQYKVKNYCSIAPNNIFGTHDLYSLSHGHVLPSLIHKIYLAKKDNKPLRVWGDGTPLREFIYANDMAKMIYKIIELDEIPRIILISSGQQISIADLVKKLCVAAKFTGEVVWETDKPNGQQARKCDLSVLKSLIDPEYTDLDVSLKTSYEWFVENYPNVRK